MRYAGYKTRIIFDKEGVCSACRTAEYKKRLIGKIDLRNWKKFAVNIGV